MSLTILVSVLAAFLGVPAIMLGVLVHYRGMAARLEQHGLHAQGTVLSVREVQSKPSTVYYAFRPPEGSELRGSFQEASSVASKRLPGSPVDILYLAEAPEQHMAVGMGLNQRLFVFFTVLLVFFSISGVASVLKAYFTQPR
ncbi:DUF3592 domain-containing protein [Corallococcus llansteffanensis]|uniref:DUF3592 domain-containing protein n=1 Tax=Corallococcus llansteffanensis TaxID=2316731 RepID=A0A3A8QCK5_9BACT|nr:DUF3592 domain-containing protein [Corallococcus llansteffanensis]RKH66469.1 hypothetical protein D7V93_04370 [Corallococcus llansteffanensis]